MSLHLVSIWMLKSPQINKFKLSDVKKPIKSRNSSRNNEEQAPGGLYTQVMTVDDAEEEASVTIFSKDL